MLEQMNMELEKKFEDDEVFKGMKENCIKQKDMLKNERLGVHNEFSRKAFSKNMNKCFMEQEAAPQFSMNCYQNKTRSGMQTKLKSIKK